jgi:6-phosphogluconate dehydrogenase
MGGGYEIGIVGLGAMGRNLALNLLEEGFAVAGLDRDPSKVERFRAEAGVQRARATAHPAEFLDLLRKPRDVILLVPAGPPVDAVLETLLAGMEPGDAIADGGNSHFDDTDLRGRVLAARGIAFLGLGISGGEQGARCGASIMAGGPPETYERIRPVLEAAAAVAGGEPCVARLGPGSAGHYVKMVHNGIEYALMELIAECYDLLHRGLGLAEDAVARAVEAWDRSGLGCYLLEITAAILRRPDEKTGRPLVEMILDEARGKGTGMWTVQEAAAIGVPIPAVDAAVSMRSLSALKEEREVLARLLPRPPERARRSREVAAASLGRAFRSAAIISFDQGIALLRRGSEVHGYGIPLAEVARIWRAGCIIRTALLEEIRKALARTPDIRNLLLDDGLSRMVLEGDADLRRAVEDSIHWRIPVPGLSACLAYLDGLRSDWLPANLIQAQRDYFGAHTYERIDDRKGVFHTEWRAPEGEENPAC